MGVGLILIAPDNHAVQIPAGFAVKVVAIPGPEHAVAGWWLDAGPSSPVVLLVHGMRADRSSMVPRAQLLSRHGFSVLRIDLQAHGDTPGEAITLGYRESADIVAARNWIKKEAPGRKIGVIGCSLAGQQCCWRRSRLDSMPWSWKPSIRGLGAQSKIAFVFAWERWRL